MIRKLLIACAALAAAPAHAQQAPLPRFDALDKQLQVQQQREIDQLATQQQAERNRASLPGSGVSQAEQALRDLEFQRQRDGLLLKGEQDRARAQRERDLANAALPNLRVPRSSTAVVSSPEAYLLPPAPPGKYYARVEGHFVLVDSMSELVTDVLPVQPTDPTADVPAGPRPPPLPGLPVRRIASTSALAIPNPAAFSLPPAPSGQFYARLDGQILLVDARTEIAVKVVGPG
jgi:Ni/Co efflux regulator RcnB